MFRVKESRKIISIFSIIRAKLCCGRKGCFGAFTDEEVKKIMKMPFEETPLYIMPIGRIE